MTVHGGRGGKAKGGAHLAHGGAIAFLTNAGFDAVKHRLLAFGDLFAHGDPFFEQMFVISLTGTFVRFTVYTNKGSMQGGML